MFLKDLFFKDIIVKLISLALAILLWSFVVGQEKAEVSLSVPVTIVNIPANMVIANDFPANVNLRVSGPKMMLARLSASAPTKVIDLKNADAGAIKIDIRADDFSLPGGVSINRIQPSAIELVLEPLITRKVPVNARMEGEVNADYKLGDVTLTPPYIAISGPASSIKKVQKLSTRPVNINNATATVIQRVKVDIPYESIHSVDVDQVEVRVNVAPAKGMEKYDKVKIIVEPPSADVSVKPDKISITAAGEKPRLHHIHPDDIKAVVNISGMKKGKHKVAPEITLPFGLKFIQAYPDKVLLTVKKDQPVVSANVTETVSRTPQQKK